MRVKTLLTKVLGLGRAVVICGWELHDGDRPRVEGEGAHQDAAAWPLRALRDSRILVRPGWW